MSTSGFSSPSSLPERSSTIFNILFLWKLFEDVLTSRPTARCQCTTSMQTLTIGTCLTGTVRTLIVSTRWIWSRRWQWCWSEQVGPSLPMPGQMTVCLRTLHDTLMFPTYAYAFAFAFGSLLPVSSSTFNTSLKFTFPWVGNRIFSVSYVYQKFWCYVFG